MRERETRDGGWAAGSKKGFWTGEVGVDDAWGQFWLTVTGPDGGGREGLDALVQMVLSRFWWRKFEFGRGRDMDYSGRIGRRIVVCFFCSGGKMGNILHIKFFLTIFYSSF